MSHLRELASGALSYLLIVVVALYVVAALERYVVWLVVLIVLTIVARVVWARTNY